MSTSNAGSAADPFVGGTIRVYCPYCHHFAVFDLEADGRHCRSCERFIRTLGRCGHRRPEWGEQYDSLEMPDGSVEVEA